jgi:polysaccharide biosynthesis/export protein
MSAAPQLQQSRAFSTRPMRTGAWERVGIGNALVEQYATQNVSVMGQVRNPGMFPITTPQPIIKGLALAGGLTELADRNITIQRGGDPDKRVTYFLSNRSEAAFTGGVTVNPGDTVLVPKAPIVYVLGDVGRPGAFSIGTNDSKLTALQAIAMAGSVAKSAVPSKARLIRRGQNGTQELPLQLSAIQKGTQPDIDLQADDIIYVPFSFLKNAAMGTAQIAAQTASAAITVVH